MHTVVVLPNNLLYQNTRLKFDFQSYLCLIITICVAVPLVSSQTTLTLTNTKNKDNDKFIIGNVVKGLKYNGNKFTPKKKNIGNVYNVIVKKTKAQLPEKQGNNETEAEEMWDMEQDDYIDPINLITMEVSHHKWSIVIYSYCHVQCVVISKPLRFSQTTTDEYHY